MSAQIMIYCGVVQNTLNCCYFDFIISEALLKHEIDKVMSQYCKHYVAHFMVDIHFIEGKKCAELWSYICKFIFCIRNCICICCICIQTCASQKVRLLLLLDSLENWNISFLSQWGSFGWNLEVLLLTSCICTFFVFLQWGQYVRTQKYFC